MDAREMAKKGMECCINSTGYFDPCERCPYEKHTEGCKAMLKDLADYIRGLEARARDWISVIEDDPPEGSYVLAVGDAEDDVPAVAYIEGGKWLEVDTPYEETEVHERWRGGAMFWMPLPEPPEEVEHATD